MKPRRTRPLGPSIRPEAADHARAVVSILLTQFGVRGSAARVGLGESTMRAYRDGLANPTIVNWEKIRRVAVAEKLISEE